MPGGIDMSPRVLVVEDDAAIAELLRYNLEAEGYLSTVVGSGEEAELQVAEDHFDLAIVDWMLPGLSGIELCRRLRRREDTRGVPILMLTARGEEDDRVRGLGIGADDYVVKPFSLPSCSRASRRCCGGPPPTASPMRCRAATSCLTGWRTASPAAGARCASADRI
jgi:CheY-like chemotaxis protein